MGVTKRVLKRMFQDPRMSLLIDWMTKDDTDWMFGEVLSGVVDGSNRVFTSTKTPLNASNVALFVAYAFALKPTDYTVEGKTWTLNENIVAPDGGERLIAFYKYSKAEA